MALREILVIPDPRLRAIAEPVNEITAATRALIADMLETMYDAPGIGLAATQIGVMQRIVVVDCAKQDAVEANPETGEEASPAVPPEPIALINPEIIWVSEETRLHEEGCLSIPDYYEMVERPDRIKVRYLDENGQTVERDADGLLATCVQHEIDHLNGKLFIDYISRLKRERVTKKFLKAAKRTG